MQALFKHPAGLYILGFAEIWDRLTFYGIQSVLILYLLKTFVFNYTQAYTTFGIYSSLAFGMPLAGGYLADKLLKQSHAVTLGALLIIAGCLVLLISSPFAFFSGVSIIIMGIGLFKPNITAQVNHLYQSNDPAREAGMTIFYTLMNVGGVLGPIIYGLVAIKFGWDIGFALSALGMMVSLFIYLGYKRRLLDMPSVQPSVKTAKPLAVIICYGMLLAAIAVFVCIFYYHWLFNLVVILFLIGVVVILILSALQQSPLERKKLSAFVILNVFSIIYYTCFMQTASSLLLFVHHYVPRTIFGFTVPANVFVSLEPFFVIVLTVVFAPLWLAMAKRRGHHSVIQRAVLSLCITSVAFVIFACVGYVLHRHTGFNWPLLGIVVGNACLGVGELAIGPALIASVSYLAPPKQQSTYVGLWMLGCAFSGYLGSCVAKLTAVGNSQHLQNYISTFWGIAISVAIAAVVLMSLKPALRALFPARQG